MRYDTIKKKELLSRQDPQHACPAVQIGWVDVSSEWQALGQPSGALKVKTSTGSKLVTNATQEAEL